MSLMCATSSRTRPVEYSNLDFCQALDANMCIRDYSSELSEQLLLKDGTFQPHLMTLWSENLPAMINECPEKSFVAVDEEINKLDNNARDAHFRQDCLKLTRDCATLGLLYKSEAKHERAVKVQKVSHLKAQNTTGANFIKGFMCANHKHVAGRVGELEAAMDEARPLITCQPNSPTQDVINFKAPSCLIVVLLIPPSSKSVQNKNNC